jgi:hypothetical protein
MQWLKKLSPTHEPVGYAFLLVVLFQLFVKGDPLPEQWGQYVIEFVTALGARQLVRPQAKINSIEENLNGRGD